MEIDSIRPFKWRISSIRQRQKFSTQFLVYLLLVVIFSRLSPFFECRTTYLTLCRQCGWVGIPRREEMAIDDGIRAIWASLPALTRDVFVNRQKREWETSLLCIRCGSLECRTKNEHFEGQKKKASKL